MSPTPELLQALMALRKLTGEDLMAIAAWLRQQGRTELRARGATDENIGPARMDIDRFGDAPLG